MHSKKILNLGLSIYAVSTLISMAAMSVGLAIALAAILIASGGPRQWWASQKTFFKKGESRRYFYLALALAGACLISAIAALVWPVTYVGYTAPLVPGNLVKLWYLFLPLTFAPALASLTPQEQRTILRAWLGASIALALVGIQQHWTGWPRVVPIPETLNTSVRYHATLLLGHHLTVATVFLFPFFALLDIAKGRAGLTLPQWPRLGTALGAALVATLLLMTYARSVWIALPLGLAAWALFAMPWRRSVAVIIAMGLTVLVVSQHPFVQYRIRSSMGISERYALWRVNLQFFKDRPLTGVGFKQNEELAGRVLLHELRSDPVRSKIYGGVFSGHAHNNWIEMLGGTGLLGFLAFFAWQSWWIVTALRLRRSRDALFATGAAAAWVAFHINGLTQVNFWESKSFHQILWCTAWLILWSARDEKSRR